MSTTAKMARYKRELKKIEAHKAEMRKPEAQRMPVEVKYVGWDIPNDFVVGYGLDYRQKYRNLRDIGTLSPHVYS